MFHNIFIISFSAFIFLLSPSAFSQNEIFFKKHPVINDKVENWFNTFIINLLSEELSQTEIVFSQHTDMSVGRIEGVFKTFINSIGNELDSQVGGNFKVYLNPNEGKTSEYGIHFEKRFEIDQTDSFIYFLSDALSLCGTAQKTTSVFNSFCETTQSQQWDKQNSKVQNISRTFKTWKTHLIEQFYEIKNPEIVAIQDELVSFIDKNIVIQEDEDTESVTLDIDFRFFKAVFLDKAPNFFKDTQLIDYSIESIKIDVFEEKIFAYFHFKKLHVANRINLYVELMSRMQGFIEDSQRAELLAKSLRNDLKIGSFNTDTVIKEQLTLGEVMGIGLNVGKILVLGSENDQVLSDVDIQVEEDLGLE